METKVKDHESVEVDVGMFLKGLVSAVIGGVATSVAQSQTAPVDFDHMSKAAVAGALLGGCSYLVGHVHGQDKGKADAEAGAGAAAETETQKP